MAITKIKGTSSFTNLTKYDSFLAGNPAFSPGAYESIASFTPTSGSSVTFSSIPSTYVSLQIRYSIITSSAGAIIQLRFNGDTTSNKDIHKLQGDGSTAQAGANINQTNIMIGDDLVGTSTTQPTVGIVDIHNYASTTQNKTVRTLAGIDQNGTGAIALLSGLWRSTSAINSATIVFGGATFSTGSTISLYGIKGS